MRPRVPLAPSLSEPGSSANHLKKQLKEQEGAEHLCDQERGGASEREEGTSRLRAALCISRLLEVSTGSSGMRPSCS